MINALLVVLHVGAMCPHGILKAGPGEILTNRDMEQANTSAQRCAVKYPNSPCLGTVLKKDNTTYQVTCVEANKKDTDNDDKTKNPSCNSCHLPKHPDDGDSKDAGNQPGQNPVHPRPDWFPSDLFSKPTIGIQGK